MSTPSTAHGAMTLAETKITGYSLDLPSGDGQVGDRGSQTAFREVLDEWRRRIARASGSDPLGHKPTEDISPKELDRADDHAEGERLIRLAIDDFSADLARVVTRFRADKSWQGVERIVVGGGFKETDIGRQAIAATAERLAADGHAIAMTPLRHKADDGGLIGWLHALPEPLRRDGRAILAVDIGGTNVRCGIVAREHGPEGDDGRVLQRERWTHADDDPEQDDLIEGIVTRLKRLLAHAGENGIALAPFIGIACPGQIRPDGSIESGTENLPGDWNSASFHLPRRLKENLPEIAGAPTCVLMHNDAVIQGLSEMPQLRGLQRWAVLTIGTGLGNAAFENLRAGPRGR